MAGSHSQRQYKPRAKVLTNNEKKTKPEPQHQHPGMMRSSNYKDVRETKLLTRQANTPDKPTKGRQKNQTPSDHRTPDKSNQRTPEKPKTPDNQTTREAHKKAPEKTKHHQTHQPYRTENKSPPSCSPRRFLKIPILSASTTLEGRPFQSRTHLAAKDLLLISVWHTGTLSFQR